MSYTNTELDPAFLNYSLDSPELDHGLLRETNQGFEDWLDSQKLSGMPFRSATIADSRKPREIIFAGQLIVNGYIAGAVSSEEGDLILDRTGEIDGDISVRCATIYGSVRGDIHARTKVELASSARVIGDIETAELSIQPGATFEGRCKFPSEQTPAQTAAAPDDEPEPAMTLR